MPHSSILCQASNAKFWHPCRLVSEAESGIEYRNYAVRIVRNTGRATAPLRLISLKPVSTSPSSDLSSHLPSPSTPTAATAGLQAFARADITGGFFAYARPMSLGCSGRDAAKQAVAAAGAHNLQGSHRLDSALQASFDFAIISPNHCSLFLRAGSSLSRLLLVLSIGRGGCPCVSQSVWSAHLRLLQAVILGRDRAGDRDHPPDTAPGFSPSLILKL